MHVRNSLELPSLHSAGATLPQSAVEEDASNFTISRGDVNKAGNDTGRHTDNVEESQERLTRETTSDDEIVVNQNNAPFGDEDVHMRGSQDATKLEQPYIDTQAFLAVGDTLLVETDGLYNFTDARPEPVSMVAIPSEGGTVGADLTIEEVINQPMSMPPTLRTRVHMFHVYHLHGGVYFRVQLRPSPASRCNFSKHSFQ